jgi:hypothetical protein
METQARFTGETLGECADVVIAHRQHYNLQPQDHPTVELEIQRQICEGMFPHVCTAEPGENYQPLQDRSRGLDADKIMAFTGAAFRFIESGGELVTKEESARRAAICRGCQYNRRTTCICTPIFKMLDALVPSSRRESGLAICGICGCSLEIKTLLPMSTIQSDNAGKSLRFPAYCWMNEPDGQKTT